ncbi:MAG: YDG domain-containing protein, partial [Verrucomicrobiota bacterium]
SGQWGYADGIGSDARFNYPQGVAADGAGNVYVVDSGNNLIRKGVSDRPASLGSSSLGAPTDPANVIIDLGSLSSSAALVYSGLGETTSRPLNLAGTTGGAFLDQSGGGLLRFTGPVLATGEGSKTLVLQGSTFGAGELAGVISDNSPTNTTSLFKQGTGAWVLSGTNTYSGGTTLAQGTLVLGSPSALGTGTLTINQGTTLDASFSGSALVALPQIWNGDFTFIGSQDLDLSVSSITLAANTMVTVRGGLLVLGNVSGGFDLTKNGLGTMVLTGSNPLTGNVRVLSGTLILDGPDAVPAGAIVNAAAGATVFLENGAQVYNFTGAGTIVKPIQTLTFDAPTLKTYGDEPFTLTTTTSSNLPATLTVLSGQGTLNGSTLILTGAGTLVVQATLPETPSLAAAQPQVRTLNVLPRQVFVGGLSAVNRVYDATIQAPLVGVPTLVDGSILFGDDVVLSGTATGSFDSSTVGAAKPVMVSGLSLTGAKASSYELMPVTGLFADVTTRFVNVANVLAQDKVYDGQLSVALVGQVMPMGLVEGDAVTFVPKFVGMLEDPNVGAS